tara:strand:+ start:274 stop:1065 length:792 start_codon:yes stop_codon:yes gene_type:complete
MQFGLVFDKTDDTIDFVSTNSDLVNYYVTSVNADDKNSFKIQNSELLSNIKYLQKCIIDTNDFFENKLKKNTFTEFVNANIYNQTILNRLHMVWVKFQIENPSISTMLEKIDNTLLTKFRDINHVLHKIESTMFVISNFNSYKLWSCENIFQSNIIDFNSYNLSINFNNLGRSTYNKWIYHDDNAYDSDTDDFTTLSGELILRTFKPHTRTAPLEYVEWCQTHNVLPVGYNIGLGNLVQPPQSAQEILHRNMQIESNGITIKV